MELTAKQRKGLIASAVALGVFHFAPGVIANIRHGMQPHTPVKPSPVRIAPPVIPSAPIVIIPTQEDKLSQLTGIWGGRTVLQSRGSCGMRLELHPKPEIAGYYTAYTTLGCANNLAFLGRPNQSNQIKATLNAVTPVSSILTGTTENGAITLNLDQTVSSTPDGCYPVTMKLTPFGDSALSVSWEEEQKCESGQMIMQRMPK